MAAIFRGEVWNADLDPIRGHEQAGKRPVLVVSTDAFSSGSAELAVVMPIASKAKGIPWHVSVKAGEAGLRTQSFIMCEMIRSIAHERLSKRLGSVTDVTMGEVERRLRILLEL
jgi:mRNA interferase MazF